jgi:hypothetical protein
MVQGISLSPPEVTLTQTLTISSCGKIDLLVDPAIRHQPGKQQAIMHVNMNQTTNLVLANS